MIFLSAFLPLFLPPVFALFLVSSILKPIGFSSPLVFFNLLDLSVFSSFSISRCVNLVTDGINDAAKASITRGSWAHKPKAWWSAEINELVFRRRCRRKRAHESPANLHAYRVAHNAARSGIKTARRLA